MIPAIFVFAYLAVVVYIGVFAFRRSKGAGAEDVFLARKQKESLHPLVNLVDLMPLYMFNAYGASTDWIARDRPLLQ